MRKIDMEEGEDEKRKKVYEILKYLQNSYYVNSSDIEIDGNEMNSTILFMLLTGLVDGKCLIIGNYGIGKTTSAEALLSLLHSLPVEVYRIAKLNGHPEQTEEKMIGRPDLGALNQGKEKVMWSLFSQVPGKIIDEINRLPEGKQTELLDAIDRGIFKYLNQELFQPQQSFFATANYPDRGNTPLIPTLADRFDVEVEARRSKFAVRITEEEVEEEKRKISDIELARKVINVFLSDKEYEEKLEELKKYKWEFYEKRKEIVFSPEELEEVKEEIKSLRLSRDAHVFLTFLNLSLYDPYIGEKRPDELEPGENHYQKYLPGIIKNSLSQRFFNSVVKYAKGIAWLRGHKEVEIEDLIIVLPYTLAHRADYDKNYLDDIREKRNDVDNYQKEFLNLYASYELVKRIISEFNELRKKINNALNYARNGNMEELEKMVKDNEHPLFRGLLHIYKGIRKYGNQ